MLVKKRGIALKGLNKKSPGMSELYDSEMFLPEEISPDTKETVKQQSSHELLMDFIVELESILELFPEPVKRKPCQRDLFNPDDV